jgi:hypothetical protein
VNNKHLVSFIVFILLGFIATGNSGKQVPSHLHPGEYLVYDTGVTVEDHAVAHNDRPVFRCNLPAKRQLSIKSRFRAVSFIQLSPTDTNQLVGATCFIPSVKETSGINTVHLPPFYYIFLFRLTPF